MKFFRVLAIFAVCFAVIGCGKKQEEVTVGWLRVAVDTAYKGQPLHFVEYARCYGRRVPGGSFGATPATHTISMRPKSFGRTMPDGSFVAFRAPELCGGYFARSGTVKDWGMTPTSFVPLMTWADRERRPSVFEAYIAQEAYSLPSSVFAPPNAVAEPLTSVAPEIEAAAGAKKNIILQDTGLISDENEIGYRSGERGFRASFGWPASADRAEADYEFASDCLTEFRSGQLVPGREVHGHLTLDQCRNSLARVIPFIWNGNQYNANPRRPGMLIFQRVSPAMNNASYFAGQELIRQTGTTRKPPGYRKYDITHVAAPVRDPNLGV